MYLLIPGQESATEASCIFTFHYVSINSQLDNINVKTLIEFTFHYVSINSGSTLSEEVAKKIYIPLCIY